MPAHRDQAEGLRRLFGAVAAPTLVPVVAAPQLPASDSLLDQLVGAYLERGLKLLVVDASARAQPASELARVDLRACVQRLSGDVAWLDARGLVAHHLDARGQATGLRQRLADAAPQARVILLHAPVAELARVLPGAPECRPVLLADLEQASITAAYAAMKWLHQRAGHAVFNLLLAAHPELALARRVMTQLADTAERFLGVAVAEAVAVDVRQGPRTAVAPGLRRLARDSLDVPAHNDRHHAGVTAAVPA